MSYYWELVTKDDSRYEIPPEVVPVVQRRIGNKDPINLSTASIPYGDIKHFRITDKPFGEQLVLEAAARAFNQPIINDDGSIVCRWVKKSVPHQLYGKHYAHLQGYHHLSDDGNMVVIAFKVAAHDVSPDRVAYCTVDEIRELEHIH